MATRYVRKPEVHEALAKTLKEKGLTHQMVAHRLGITVRTVKNLVSSGDFTPKTALRWAKTFGISYSTFGAEKLDESSYQVVNMQLSDLRTDIDALYRQVRELKAKLDEVDRQTSNPKADR